MVIIDGHNTDINLMTITIELWTFIITVIKSNISILFY